MPPASEGLAPEPAVEQAPTALVGFLRSEGAGELGHGTGRTLLDHLQETYAIVRRWAQPEWLAHAALLHSIFGTDRYRHQLVPLSRRSDVRELAGPRAERIAYLFSAVPRGPLLAGTYRWASVPVNGDEDPPARVELDATVLLHMANMAEQARARNGSPGNWLVGFRKIGELLIDSDALVLPAFVAKLARFGPADEMLVRRTYRTGVRSGDQLERRMDRLALAAAVCPVVPEPCVWLAYLARCRDDVQSARWWAGCARERLVEFGTSWDKRLSFEQWFELARALERMPAGAVSEVALSPGELLQDVLHGAGRRAPSTRSTGGRERFNRYVEALVEEGGGIYPDLESRPWLDASQFAVARYLEAHCGAIREEILALDPSNFHRESERIERSGDWDVAFLYERGRRRDEVCDACPVTARGIEAPGAVRTMVGLAYASRMRAGTHIAAHRGPTNLRVRCHLGIQVPKGDCGIRVADEVRTWEEGRCLVFDDHFEHEAWNHTGEDRIVLIVDLWHPGLSATELTLLEGLHDFASTHARKLTRYWAANAAAARETS